MMLARIVLVLLLAAPVAAHASKFPLCDGVGCLLLLLLFPGTWAVILALVLLVVFVIYFRRKRSQKDKTLLE